MPLGVPCAADLPPWNLRTELSQCRASMHLNAIEVAFLDLLCVLLFLEDIFT